MLACQEKYSGAEIFLQLAIQGRMKIRTPDRPARQMEFGIRNSKLETGNWKLETGNWEFETGNSKTGKLKYLLFSLAISQNGFVPTEIGFVSKSSGNYQ
jgi:hypothetical protein